MAGPKKTKEEILAEARKRASEWGVKKSALKKRKAEDADVSVSPMITPRKKRLQKKTAMVENKPKSTVKKSSPKREVNATGVEATVLEDEVETSSNKRRTRSANSPEKAKPVKVSKPKVETHTEIPVTKKPGNSFENLSKPKVETSEGNIAAEDTNGSPKVTPEPMTKKDDLPPKVDHEEKVLERNSSRKTLLFIILVGLSAIGYYLAVNRMDIMDRMLKPLFVKANENALSTTPVVDEDTEENAAVETPLMDEIMLEGEF